jgi:hypothetical protein
VRSNVTELTWSQLWMLTATGVLMVCTFIRSSNTNPTKNRGWTWNLFIHQINHFHQIIAAMCFVNIQHAYNLLRSSKSRLDHMLSTQGGQTETYKTIYSGYNNLFRVSKHVCIYYYNEQGLEQQNRPFDIFKLFLYVVLRLAVLVKSANIAKLKKLAKYRC